MTRNKSLKDAALLFLVIVNLVFIIVLTSKGLAISKIAESSDVIQSRFGGLNQSVVDNTIYIASVVCGGTQKAKNIMPLIKTAILMSESPLHIHLFSDKETAQEIKNRCASLQDHITKRVKIEYHDIWYPKEHREYWASLYKPCASQRIFFPSVIHDTNKIIYVDSDIIFTGKLENIWAKFNEFEPQQIMAATSDCSYEGCAFYNKIIGLEQTPTVFNPGMNSGVLFMMLDRLKEFKFEEKMAAVALDTFNQNNYQLNGNQIIMNILFHNQSEVLKELDCSYNYLPHRYCANPKDCDRRDGIKIVHGTGKRFLKLNGTLFHMLFNKLIDLDINKNRREIMKDLITKVDEFNGNDNCTNVKTDIFKDFRE